MGSLGNWPLATEPYPGRSAAQTQRGSAMAQIPSHQVMILLNILLRQSYTNTLTHYIGRYLVMIQLTFKEPG